VDQDTETATATAAPQIEPLTAGGSSTVYPIVNTAASYWNANPSAADAEYWPHEEYGIETRDRLADYWAGQYGFLADAAGEPQFDVTVGLSHSQTGLLKLREEQIDLGNGSAPAEATLPDLDTAEYDRFVDHVVAVDALAVGVSDDIADEGVTELTGEDLAAIYEGSITNWSSVGGPDREIEVLGRPEGSGSQAAFAAAVLDDPDAETAVDDRYQPGQRLAVAIQRSDAAIGYLTLAFVDERITPLSLTWGGTTYGPDGDAGFAASSYPLSRDLHVYSWDETSAKEAAVLRLLLSDFGQGELVAANGYRPLPDARRREERAKLPPTTEAARPQGTPATTVPQD
jgi:phosphate transport system substrate-binding protein